MKKVIFLTGSLLLSITTIAQTYSAPDSAGDNGDDNVFLGHEAGLNAANDCKYNLFVGYQSGYNTTSGHKNVFAGYKAGYSNITGQWNVAVGYNAGITNESDGGTFIGANAGKFSDGYANTFTGLNSGMNNSTGNGNCFYGYYAGYNSTGGYNVILGYSAGLNAGNYNVFLGFKAGYNETGSNKLYISNSETSNPLVYGEFDTKKLKFNANKVGIGPDFGSFPALTGLANADDYRLFVRGGILAEEVRIRLQSDWADYVFSDDYKLPTLKETEAFINENKHLPNMPSAKQVEEEGIEMGNIIKLQQEKIEELTLYTIEQEKKLEKQGEEIELLKSQMELLLSKQ